MLKDNKRLLTFESDDFAGGIHDCWIGRDGASDGISRVVEVNDDNLGRISDLLAHTDELVRLHRQRTEPDVGGIDAQVLQLSTQQFNIHDTHMRTIELCCSPHKVVFTLILIPSTSTDFSA